MKAHNMPDHNSAIVLRDYQSEAVARIRAAFAAHRRVLFQLPTGGGKTVVFAYIIASAMKHGRRVLILTHRVEILDQIQAALAIAGVSYGVIAPGHPVTDDLVQIASVASLAQPKRLERWRDRFDFMVVDECHHSVSPTWTRVLESQPRAAILGVTATPERLDGKGLGEIFGELIVGPSTAELIPVWLVPPRVFEPAQAPDMSAARIRGGDYAIEDLREAMDGIVIGAAVDEYQRLAFRPWSSASTSSTRRRSLSGSVKLGGEQSISTARRLPATAVGRLPAYPMARSRFSRIAV
jgi:DNA repair protein RadD